MRFNDLLPAKGKTMAWLVQQGKTFHIGFRFGGREFKRSLRTTNRNRAEAAVIRVVDNLEDIGRGRLAVPDGADIAAFLLTDGKQLAKPQIKATPKLGVIFDEYRGTLPNGALEDATIATTAIHMNHMFKHFGRGQVFSSLGTSQLQGYVNHRSKRMGPRGKPISGTTIRKEVATLRMLWSFSRDRGYVTGTFPMRGVRFPKVDQKEPFQTYAQITRRIERSNLSDEQQEELWECLYLTVPEIEELLDFIEAHARHDFIYPMVVTAAHTGARRSELVRSRLEDFDLDSGTMTIHERKRNREQRTTRRVAISSRLKNAIAHWMAIRPESDFVFYPGDINPRQLRPGRTITVDQAHHHFKQSLSGKWDVVRGWHVLRHSFASNLASQGVDQRIIDSWMGHQTAEMRKRYQHLIPDAQQSAMRAVFG